MDLGQPTDAQAWMLYSPIDDVHGALVDVLKGAQHSVVVAMYGFDDDELADIILAHMKDPNVFVQLTLDRSQAGGVHEKLILQKFPNSRVAIGTSEKGAIMHRKMAVVDGEWLIGGSTNWSDSGETKQDNELTIHHSPKLCARARTVLDIEHDHALEQMKARA
ncbi:phospholipase D-like domain-containing protein [Sinomonas sp. JGH33]|uniref:phospholipase D n=1 Tax=Sinomonas terricola TaxID=3110330 RepID=A0ABU5T0Y2_9MICC|nr:phospholipase D-like domain-containing protein [Sinomonas sp. JGH33]MEA5453315.1 phospholipase D-like domain-containing protein [Sinomonas sp. JGH33]